MAIVLFGHGSRDPQWRQSMDEVAARLRARAPSTRVRCAFLELQQPDLATTVADLVAQGATGIRVLPMFLGVGRHAREDLPTLLEQARSAHPQVTFELLPTVGEAPQVLDLLADLALGNKA